MLVVVNKDLTCMGKVHRFGRIIQPKMKKERLKFSDAKDEKAEWQKNKNK